MRPVSKTGCRFCRITNLRSEAAVISEEHDIVEVMKKR